MMRMYARVAITKSLASPHRLKYIRIKVRKQITGLSLRSGRMRHGVRRKGMGIRMVGIVSIGKMWFNLEVIRAGNRKRRTMMTRIKNERLQLLLKVLASQIKKCCLRDGETFR